MGRWAIRIIINFLSGQRLMMFCESFMFLEVIRKARKDR